MFQRPTSLAAAFVNAAVAQHGISVDKGHGNWIARRTLLNTDRPGFGVVKEVDHRPGFRPDWTQTSPRVLQAERQEAVQSFVKSAALDEMTTKIINDSIGEVVAHLAAGRAFLTDEEILGVD